MIRPGEWSVTSKSDPRWNCSGRAKALALGYFPPEAELALKEREATLGARPPDLSISWMKD